MNPPQKTDRFYFEGGSLLFFIYYSLMHFFRVSMRFMV